MVSSKQYIVETKDDGMKHSGMKNDGMEPNGMKATDYQAWKKGGTGTLPGRSDYQMWNRGKGIGFKGKK